MSECCEDQCIRCSRRMEPEELESVADGAAPDPAGGEYCLLCLKTKLAEAERDIRDLETERDDVAACIRRIEARMGHSFAKALTRLRTCLETWMVREGP